MDDLTDKTISELQAIAFSDITDFCSFGASGVRLKSLSEVDPQKIVAVREVVNGKRETGVKMHDKMKALELLMKYLGMTSDFNLAIACLRKFGINLAQDAAGKWYVDDQETTDPDQSQII